MTFRDNYLANYRLAASFNHRKLFGLCRNCGVEVSEQDNDGNTALHFASEMKFYDLAKHLVNSGADLSVENRYGNQPLWPAVFYAHGRFDLVELMLAKGANPLHRNRAGKSALELASEQFEDHQLTRLLTSSKAGDIGDTL